MHTDTEYLQFMWPMRSYMITCGDIERNPNIITLSFVIPVSKDPPMLACAITTTAHSRGLIDKYREFIVNVPTAELESAINFCGFNSGRDVDKFKKTGLSPEPARRVKAPIIGECVAFMECTLKDNVLTGDKILFIGEVIESYADTSILSSRKIDFIFGEFPTHVYGNRFSS